MKNLRWQFIVVVVAIVAIGLLLFSQQQTTLPGFEPVNEPIQGGEYTEALIGSLGRLNPVLDYYNSADYDVDRLLFSRLVRFDDRGLPQFDLAQDLGISQDGKVYNFSIRPDAVWHDGEPVTSEDIIFTVDLIRDEEIPLPADIKEFWEQITVEALDEKTLQFRLPEPFSPFMDYLDFGILPSHLLKEIPPAQVVDIPYNLNPIGSGPFRFENLVMENGRIAGVVLEAFEDYYGEEPFIEQVVFKYYPDAEAAMSAYEQGEVMGISRINSALLPEALRISDLNTFTGRLPRLSLVYLNLDNSEVPFFQEQAVRKALLMGVNRRWIVDKILGGQGIIAHSPIFPESWAYYEDIERTEFDPGAATDLLRNSGYSIPSEGGGVRIKDGIPLTFELVHPDDELNSSIAEQIRKDWERLGVDVVLNPVPYEELLEDYLEPRTYQAALVELDFSRSPDPDPYPFWHQAQINDGQNYAQWDDRQVSEYLEQARVMVDLIDRTKRYRNFQVRFASELPALPLYYPVFSYGISDLVRGVSVGPVYDRSDRFNTLLSWYLITGPAGQVQMISTSGP